MTAHQAAVASIGDDFEEPRPQAVDLLVVDVSGFEGPLDLLLKLARDQKVDLSRISILALAEQYLAFIETARRLRLEIAADYLVMAAWLAYLKSRLLLPEEEDEEPSGEALAAVLAQRLRHLEAMRAAGKRLMSRPRLGIEIFPRGDPEQAIVHASKVFEASLYDLLSAYATVRSIKGGASVTVRLRTVISLQEARDRLIVLLGASTHWAPLDSYLLEYLVQPDMQRTARASALSASLELVREGTVELKQSQHFAPLYVRRRAERVSARGAADG